MSLADNWRPPASWPGWNRTGGRRRSGRHPQALAVEPVKPPETGGFSEAAEWSAPLDPDTLDPAELRKEADFFERFAVHKRQFADLIELSCFTAMLNATDGEGRRGVDKLLALDPMTGLTILRQLYARVAALAVQVAAKDWACQRKG
jgi:hypothetical protein